MSATKIKVNTSVPLFLWKVWVLLSDTRNNRYIRWTINGDSFVVVDVLNFSKVILPQYFKHSNFASFVRQLNLYGFRKVIDVQQGIHGNAESDQYEFQHPLFKRGRQDLIEQIKRKLSGTTKKFKTEDVPIKSNNVQTLTESHQEISSQLSLLREQNERIWSELIMLRDQHDRQSKVLDRLITFFASVFRPHNGGLSNGLLNNFLQDGDNSSHYSNILSTLANANTNNDIDNNVQNNSSFVPLESILNLNFNNNPLAALTFNMPPAVQQVDNNCLIDDPLYSLSGNDNSFQELPLTMPNGGNNNESTEMNKNENPSVYDSTLIRNLSDNVLFQQKPDNSSASFPDFNNMATNTQENNFYGLSLLSPQHSNTQAIFPGPTMVIGDELNNVVDDCGSLNHESPPMNKYLSQKRDDEFNDNDDRTL